MKKVKKVVSIFAAAVLLSSYIPSLVSPAHAAGMAGSGTETDPYVITTVEDLQDMQNHLTAHYILGSDIDASVTSTWNSGKGFVPIGTYIDEASAPTTCFTGTLNGAKHTIRGLTINDPTLAEAGLFGCAYTGADIKFVFFEGANITGSSYIGLVAGRTSGDPVSVQHIIADGNVNGDGNYIGGLIGYADSTYFFDLDLTMNVFGLGSGFTVGTSTNVGGIAGSLKNAEVSDAYTDGEVRGYSSLGGFAGSITGNSHITHSGAYMKVWGKFKLGGAIGDMKDSRIDNSYTYSYTDQEDTYGGAFVGYADNSVITRASSFGDITGKNMSGAFIGYAGNNVSISQSYSYGDIYGVGNTTGGFIGYLSSSSSITNAYSLSAVQGVGSSANPTAGFAAVNDGSITNVLYIGAINASDTKYGLTQLGTGTVTNSYFNSDVAGTSLTTGGVGKTTAELKNQSTYANWDFLNEWILNPSKNHGYPYLTGAQLFYEPPTTASALTTTVNGNKVTLSWTASPDPLIHHYYIYRNGAYAGSTKSTAWTSGSLAYGTYSFVVTSADYMWQESDPSVVATATIVDPATIPAVPTGLTGTNGDGIVSLTWNTNTEPNLNHYVVYKDDVALASIPAGTQSYTATGLINGTTYTFKVSAVNTLPLESAKSTPFVGTPVAPPDTTPPSGVTALSETHTHNSATLSWTDPTDVDLDHTNIYRDGALVGTSTNGTFTNPSLDPSTTYLFAVKSVDTTGNESGGSTISVTTSAAPVVPDTTPPSDVTALAETHTHNSADLSWINPTDTDFDHVNVYRDGILIGNSQGVAFTNTGLAASTTYGYTIKAVDADGNESAGASINATTAIALDTTAPSDVTGLAETHTHNTVALTWIDPTDTDYDHVKIYRDGVYVGQSTNGTYTDTGRVPSTTYMYTVKSVDTIGNESAGASVSATTSAAPVTPDTTPPQVPIGLAANESGKKATLTWTANTEPDLDHYNVYKGGVLVGTVPTGTTTWTSTTLPDGTYTYTLTAVDTTGNESGQSAPVSVVVVTSTSGSGGNSGGSTDGGGSHITVDIPKNPTDPSTPIVVTVPKDVPSTVEIPATSGTATPPVHIDTPNGTINVDTNTLPKDSGTTIIVTPIDKDSLKPGDAPTPIVVIDSKTGDGTSKPIITITKEDPFADDQYYTQDGNGDWNYVKPRKDKDGNWVVPIETPTLGIRLEDKSYSDIDDSWAKDAIDKLTNMHIVNGYSDGTFKPNGEVTRAEFTSMLVKAVLYKQAENEFNKFNDVNSTAWYYDAIVQGQNISIIKGISDTLFAPSQTIVKQETVAIAVRWIENNVGPTDANATAVLGEFADSQNISGWAKEEVAKGIKYGIVQGNEKKEIAPKKSTTRAEAATIIYNLIKNY